LLRALGSRYRSGALAQEKTGEAWVAAQLRGGHTRGEFEHAEVSVFVGKNPWMSQSFPRARVVLREIAKDPARSMIVIDPVLTDTAKMADLHPRVRPGTDAWCLAALAGTLVQEDLVDHDFIADHADGFEQVRAVFADVPVEDYAACCGVDGGLIRRAARRIGTASSVAVFDDLGIQQAPGTVISGLVPCNVIPDEILTEHPERFRAMIVESANPAHSVADSRRMAEALDALELIVVIDVAMTETARHADYVL
jgi:anaerobic selenocysteine-containing dehydrogenase